jgi:hypothetical protein
MSTVMNISYKNIPINGSRAKITEDQQERSSVLLFTKDIP